MKTLYYFISGISFGLGVALVVICIASTLSGCSHGPVPAAPTDLRVLPSRPISEVDVQGHLPPCPAGREIHYCGIFGPDYAAQCWVEGCDRE